MAEIATWSMINSKTGYGSSGSYCPTKSEILSYNDYMWKEATPIINLFK